MLDKTCKTCKYCDEPCSFARECGREDLDGNPICHHPNIICDDEYQHYCKVVTWNAYCSDWEPKEDSNDT